MIKRLRGNCIECVEIPITAEEVINIVLETGKCRFSRFQVDLHVFDITTIMTYYCSTFGF